MSLARFVKTAIPAAIGYATGGPVGAFTATARANQALQAEKKFKQQQQAQEEEFSGMACIRPK